MKWFWLYILMILSCFMRGSQDNVSSSGDSSPDHLCDMALTHHFPAQLHNESFRIRPYLRDLIEEEQRLRITIPSATSIRTEPIPDYRIISPHTPLSDLIVRAYHKALLEKDNILAIKEKDIQLREYKLSRKVSKGATIGWSALTGLLTSVITLIITIVSK